MKILEIYQKISSYELYMLLQQKLNPLFHKQRDENVNFTFEQNNGAIEIYQRDLYEGFLYHIEIRGTELYITRSEHYVDDVNSLTLESILNVLFEEVAKDGKVTLVLEG